MPQLGESIAEATVVTLKVKPGEKVVADQEIIEVETNKAVMGVTTPCAGEIVSIAAEPKETYAVGAVLGYVEASEADAAKFVKTAPEQPAGKVASEIPGREEERTKAVRQKNGATFEGARGGLPVPAMTKGAGFFRRASARAWPS